MHSPQQVSAIAKRIARDRPADAAPAGWLLRLTMPLLLLLVLIRPDAAAAAVTLAGDPATVFLEPGATARVVVTARADPAAAIANPRLVIAERAGLSHRIVRGGRSADGAALAWVVDVTAGPDFRNAVNVALRLNYRRRGRGRTASARLRIRPESPVQVSSQVSLELILDGDTLMERQSGTMFLKLTNLGNSELAVTDVRISAPFLRHEPLPRFPWTVPARGIRVEPVRVSIVSDDSHPLLTGRHPVVAVATVRRTSPERPWQADVAAAQTLSLGIPGLAELQGLVQVPSFLFLPGFLIVTCFMMTWRSFDRAADGTAWLARFAFAWSPALWVLAITLSGGVVAVYPWATSRLIGARRDVLVGFDLSDVIRVWFWSMAAGAVAAFLALAVREEGIRRRAKKEFLPMEDPLPFLRRLTRKKLDHKFKFVSIGADEIRLYLLTPQETGDMAWAAPGIRFRAGPNFNAIPLVNRIRNGTLASLLEQLEADVNSGALTLEWEAGEPRGPARVARARFAADLLDPASIVREEPAK